MGNRILSDKKIERIYKDAIDDDVIYATNLSITEFECYLDGMLIKAHGSKSEQAKDSIEKINAMKDKLYLFEHINIINNFQSKFIREIRLKNMKLEQEKNELIEKYESELKQLKENI